MKYSDYNDNELIDLLTENEEAGDILYEKYKPLIVKIAKQYHNPNISNGLELNDLISEGMIAFSQAIESYKISKEASFYTFAKTCIERKIRSVIVGTTRQKHKFLNESISMEEEFDNFALKKVLGDNSQNPENLVVTDESIKILLNSLDDELSDFEKQVFELKKSGFEIMEIAKLLDKDYKSVDNTLQRIKGKIKKCMKEEN